MPTDRSGPGPQRGSHQHQQPAVDQERHDATQPDEDASSDGDRSWAETPVTQEPRVDRSVDAVVRRESARTRAVRRREHDQG